MYAIFCMYIYLVLDSLAKIVFLPYIISMLNMCFAF